MSPFVRWRFLFSSDFVHLMLIEVSTEENQYVNETCVWNFCHVIFLLVSEARGMFWMLLLIKT